MGFTMEKTKNGHDPFEVMSAIQKMIRRNREREAMLWCLEMLESSKKYYRMMLHRLTVIAHEDIGLADPDAVQFSIQTISLLYEAYYDRHGWRMMLSNVVRRLARAQKSREADNFTAVVYQQWVNHGPGDVPDIALDQHTRRGKAKGRGMEHFLNIGSVITPEHPDGDRYKEECQLLRGGSSYRPPQPEPDEPPTKYGDQPGLF